MLAARTSVSSSAGLRSQCRTRAIAPRAPCRRPVRVMALFGGGKEGGGNPLANMGKLMESMAQAQKIVQEKTQAIQKELESTEFDGYDEEETVRVIMSGNQVPKAVEITDEAMAVGGEELSRRLTLAMKEAHGKSVMGMKEKMKDLASALGLPPSAAGLGGGNNSGLPGM